MSQWMRRAVMVTITETWTFVWVDDEAGAPDPRDSIHMPRRLTITRAVSSSCVSSQPCSNHAKEVQTDETS